MWVKKNWLDALWPLGLGKAHRTEPLGSQAFWFF